mgnify:CR=1 FL=1
MAVGANTLATQNFTTATNTYNVAVGYNAGVLITTGIRNNLFGAETGEALTQGGDNIAIGYQALTADTLGSRSVAIGNNALDAQNFTTATDAYNVAVGYAAGGATTTGIRSTLLGGLAGILMLLALPEPPLKLIRLVAPDGLLPLKLPLLLLRRRRH